MPTAYKTAGKFAVLTASAKMPASCWGKYRYCAVVELEEGFRAADVTMISPRAKAVRRVIWASDAGNVGLTERCAHRQHLAEAVRVMEAAAAGEETR